MKRSKYLPLILILFFSCFLCFIACGEEKSSSFESFSSIYNTEEESVLVSSTSDSSKEYSSSQENTSSKEYSSSQEDASSKEYGSSQEDTSSKEYGSSQEDTSSKEYSSSQEDSSSEAYSSSEEDSSIEVAPPCAHTWREESRTQYCTINGVSVLVCDSCGEKMTQATSPLGHDEVIDPARSATCEFEGKTQGSHCQRCNEVFEEQETSPKLDHIYVDDSCQFCGLAVLKFQERDGGYYCIGTDAREVRRVVIPDEYMGKPVIGIAKYSFGGRLGLNSLTIGKNVKTIEAGSFDNCYNLVEVYDFSTAHVTGKEENMIDLNNHVLDVYTEPCASKLHKDLDGYITYDWVDEEGVPQVIFLGYKGVQPADNTLWIPQGVTIINWFSVSPTKWVRRVVLSDTVTYIRRRAFYFSPNIKELVIGKSVEKMDSDLFELGTELQRVVFMDTENWMVRPNIDGGQWLPIGNLLDNPEENAMHFRPKTTEEEEKGEQDFSEFFWKKSWVEIFP
ncbi:MAG: leucine-rich repeat protein [Clostridia bacterium]|nr:leucine-rich repeat protein [Clostridia bacterium]